MDALERLNLINQAIVSLYENSDFGQRSRKTEEPPDEPEFSSDNKSYDYDVGLDTHDDGTAITHRLGWARPDPTKIVSNWGQKDAQGNPVKYDPTEYNELKTARREYNLWNQRGLDAFNPQAKAQNYSPAWNVRGDARREQTRAYLNYIRSDPERLARFRQQSSNNRIAPRKY